MNRPGLFNALYARYLYSMNMSFTKNIPWICPIKFFYQLINTIDIVVEPLYVREHYSSYVTENHWYKHQKRYTVNNWAFCNPRTTKIGVCMVRLWVVQKLLWVLSYEKSTVSYALWKSCKLFTIMKPTSSTYLPWNNNEMSLYFRQFEKAKS